MADMLFQVATLRIMQPGQLNLNFKARATAEKTFAELIDWLDNPEGSQRKRFTDYYGAEVCFDRDDIASVFLVDQQAALNYQVEYKLLEMAANAKLQKEDSLRDPLRGMNLVVPSKPFRA